MLYHGETPRDTAQVLSRLGQAIACRNCRYGTGYDYIRELSQSASVPVINLQCDRYHPVQAITDLMTLQEEFGDSLKGLEVAISWAYTSGPVKPLSVPQSQLLLFTRYGMNVTVAAPPEFPLAADIVDRARNHAAENESKLNFMDDPGAAIEGAQVVIQKNWGGFAAFDEYREDRDHRSAMTENMQKYRDWRCTPEHMSRADPEAKFLHAMPVDRGCEADDAVVDSPASIIYQAAENRLHILKALMILSMSQEGWE
jgi:ornithine carbamoyltransferase